MTETSEQHPVLPGDLVSAAPNKKKAKGDGAFFKELPFLILIAFGLALLIKTFFLQAFFIPSESMVPTLLVKDRVLVNKIPYRFRDPRRGEVIVFVGEEGTEGPQGFVQRVRSFLTEGLGVSAPSERDFIKRVIGLPGEKISTKDGKVLITPVGGKRFTLNEPYLADEVDKSPFGPFTVPKDSYFVMGDNRPNSADSRTRLGAIHKDRIVGKAFVRIWPVQRFDFFHIPSYEKDPTQKKDASGMGSVPTLGAFIVLPAVWGRVYPGERGARRAS